MQVRDILAVMATVIVVALLFTPASILADDVTVKTIDPDKPKLDQPKADQPKPDQPRPQTQPDQSAKPAVPTTPRVWTPPALLGGDWMITQAFQAAKVTDEQKAKLKPVLDELADQAKADQAKTAEMMNKARAAIKAAKDAGSKEPAKEPEVKTAAEELSKAMAEANKAMAARREKLVGALDGVLSADQIKQIKDYFDRFSPDLATRNKPLAKDWTKSSLPGVTLSDAQQEQIIAKVAPIQEKFGQQLADLQKAQSERMQQLFKEDPKTGWQKAQAEFAPKMEELRIAVSKAMNEAVESALTDEQKQQMATGRQEAWKKSVQGWVDATVRSFEGVKLTDEQKVKVKELADAAGEAMLKTDMYDLAGRNDLAGKLREDVKKLLTDEQRKLVH